MPRMPIASIRTLEAAEFGLGMNVNFTKNLYGYADFEYVTGGEIKTPYRWNAGVRYAF